MGKEKVMSIAMMVIDAVLIVFIVASMAVGMEKNYVNDTDVVLLSLVDSKEETSIAIGNKITGNDSISNDGSENINGNGMDAEIENEEIPAGIIVSLADKYISDINLSNFNIWRSGSYDKITGKHSVSLDGETKICLSDYLLASGNTEYSVQISNNEYRMTIIELDLDKKVILASDLADGITFKTNDNTKYVALTLYYYNDGNYNEGNADGNSKKGNNHQIDIWRKIFNEGIFININKNIADNEIKPSEIKEIEMDKKVPNKEKLEVETISIPATLALYEYESSVLIPKFTPLEITEVEVSYESSNPKVANVTDTGVIKAYAAGKTKITAKTANGKVATCIVTVNEVNTDPLDFTDESLWMEGNYSCNDGKYEKFEGRICLKDYIKCMSSERYMVNLSNSEYIMLVREMDSDKNFIKTVALSNEESFITTDKTRYLGISLYAPGNLQESYNEYMEMFERGMKVGLIDVEKVNVKTYTLELSQMKLLNLDKSITPNMIQTSWQRPLKYSIAI